MTGIGWSAASHRYGTLRTQYRAAPESAKNTTQRADQEDRAGDHDARPRQARARDRRGRIARRPRRASRPRGPRRASASSGAGMRARRLGAVVQTTRRTRGASGAQHAGDVLVPHRAEHQRHAPSSRCSLQVGRRARARRPGCAPRRAARRPPRHVQPSRGAPASARARQAAARPRRRTRRTPTASTLVEQCAARPRRSRPDGGRAAPARRARSCATASGGDASRRRRCGTRCGRVERAVMRARCRAAVRDHAIGLGRQRPADDRDAGLDDARLLARRSTPSVSPSCAWWSKSIDVIAAATGVTTLVASSRPPRPTSSTATSTPASRNSSNATAVVHSKNVGGAASAPARRSALDGALHAPPRRPERVGRRPRGRR